MPYTQVQFIGYQVNTFPQSDAASAHGMKYLGEAQSENDIRERCKIMNAAIGRAHAKLPRLGAAQENRILKIFMAPEFYFRGKMGGYPLEKASSVIETMRVTTKHPKFKNWLFVFGTTIGYLQEQRGRFSRGRTADVEIFNIAFVQKGGTQSAEKEASLIVYKEFISGIDFIRDESLNWSKKSGRLAVVNLIGGPAAKIRPVKGSRDLRSKKTSPVGDGREMSKSGLGGQCMFDMAGHTFGLEVCLDHMEGRLKASPPLKGSSYAQIQLVTSAGALTQPECFAIGRNGLFFQVDPRQVQLFSNQGNIDNPQPVRLYPDEIVDLNVGKSQLLRDRHAKYFDRNIDHIARYDLSINPPTFTTVDNVEIGHGYLYIFAPVNIGARVRRPF